MVFVKIRAGTYAPGHNEAQQKMLESAVCGRPMDHPNSGAAKVHITSRFFLGKYEVSQVRMESHGRPRAAGDNKGAKNVGRAVKPSHVQGRRSAGRDDKRGRGRRFYSAR